MTLDLSFNYKCLLLVFSFLQFVILSAWFTPDEWWCIICPLSLFKVRYRDEPIQWGWYCLLVVFHLWVHSFLWHSYSKECDILQPSSWILWPISICLYCSLFLNPFDFASCLLLLWPIPWVHHSVFVQQICVYLVHWLIVHLW